MIGNLVTTVEIRRVASTVESHRPRRCKFSIIRCYVVQLMMGSNASIQCMAFGDPVPRMSWFKDSRRLHNDGVRLVVVDTRDVSDARYVISHVILSHVTDHDAGDYK